MSENEIPAVPPGEIKFALHYCPVCKTEQLFVPGLLPTVSTPPDDWEYERVMVCSSCHNARDLRLGIGLTIGTMKTEDGKAFPAIILNVDDYLRITADVYPFLIDGDEEDE